MSDLTQILLAIAAPTLGAGLTWLGVRSSNNQTAAKTEGVITTEIQGITQRMDRRDLQIDEKFKTLDQDSTSQWKAINETQVDLAFLQGKANGKAH